ncbi:MAG: PspC domain-containing protein [Acidimicrobiia bacterium]
MTDSNHSRTSEQTRPLSRSRDQRIVAGVAGGLGEHLGINAWWLRWAFIILAFFGGVGFLIYFAAWLVIPDEGQKDPLVGDWVKRLDTSDGGTIFGMVLIGVAAIILFTQVAGVSSTFIIAAILFILGVMLYRGDLRVPGQGSSTEADPSNDPGSPTGSPTGPPAGADAGPSTGSAAATTLTADTPKEPIPPRETKPPRPPKPPKERSILGQLTLAIGLIVVASMALLDLAVARIEIQPVQYLGVAVAIIGVGLVVGGWAGRARWLIFVGLFLLPALWVASWVPTNWDLSAGDVEHQPTSVAEVESVYELGVGSMTVDLTALTSGELERVGSISASIGLGELIVRVPSDVGVRLHGQVGAGEISGPFPSEEGFAVEVFEELGPDPVVLDLDLEVGAGVISIKGEGVFESLNAFVLEGSN